MNTALAKVLQKPEETPENPPERPIGIQAIESQLRRLDKEELTNEARLKRLINFENANWHLISKAGYDLLADYFEERMPKG